MPDSYRDHAFFSLDPVCFKSLANDGHSADKDDGNIESESVRNVNISRLTGLLDKIKASAGSVDDSSLSSCVCQVEAAANLVENAASTAKHSAVEDNSVSSSSIPVVKLEAFQHTSSVLLPGSRTDEQVGISTTEPNSASASVLETTHLQSQGPVSRKSLPSKLYELTLNSQRLQQRQYAAAATKSSRTQENDSSLGDAWIQLGDVVLTQRHRAKIYEEELDDAIVTASLGLLRAEDQAGRYSGLLTPSQISTLEFEGRHAENLVQVMKVVNDKAPRWICVSTVGCQPATADIYDCAVPSELGGEDAYSHAVKMQIAALLTLPLDQQLVTLHSKPVAQREGSAASGLFAIAFATDLVYYQNVVGRLDQNSLASHLEACLTNGRLLPFPKSDVATGGHLLPPFTVEIPIYCKCRLPYSETRDSDEDLMVVCSADSCRIQWYHLRCVGSTDSERKRARDCSWRCDWCAAAVHKRR